MNIKEAKEQIKNTMTAYFAKDEYGYEISVEKQWSVFLMGPPGSGKTAIMEQIASELGVGLVHDPPYPSERPGPALHRPQNLRQHGVRRVRVHHERDHRRRIRPDGGYRGSGGHSLPRSTACPRLWPR